MATDIATFLLRMPREVHARVRSAAASAGMSMNEFLVQRAVSPSAANEAADVIADAEAMFGRDLLGVIEYGSVARGEAAAASDVDLLIVIDRTLPLTRDLYRRWDAKPHVASGRPADTHFTYLPNTRPTGGIWAEAAVDGRVLFERDRLVTDALRSIRNDIADGHLRRRSVHGQTYWTAT